MIGELIMNSVCHAENLTRVSLTCHEKAGYVVIWYDDDRGGIIETDKKMGLIEICGYRL